MCGRATLSSPAENVASLFDVDPIDIGPARFNIAPTQPILTVRERRTDIVDAPARRELALVRWGLIPWWAKPEEAKRVGSKCIQARAETAPRSPAFRDAFRRHRCLVIVDGFFEWKTLPDGRRIPHLVKRTQRAPFAIAGLWDSWRSNASNENAPDATKIESCAVVTTRAGGSLRDLHDRMPLVLAADEWSRWLSGSEAEAARLLEQNASILDERARDLVAVPVSTWVNNVRNDDARCIEPAATTVSESRTLELPAGQIDFGFAETAPARARRGRR